MGEKIGYIRVSTVEQNSVRQLEGINLDQVFEDKASARNTERPGLSEMLEYIRGGDELFVHSMDRLARNLDDLRGIVKGLTAKKVKIHFLKENLIFSGEDAPIYQLPLSVMGAFAEFERSLIRERQREGIELAKRRGAFKGRKKCLSSEQVVFMQEQIKAGVAKTRIAQDLGISRETLYQYVRANKASKNTRSQS